VLRRRQLALHALLHRLQRLALVALLADVLLLALGLAGELLLLVAEGLVDAGLEGGGLLLDRALFVLLALLELRVDPLGLGRDDLAKRSRGLLAALGAGGH